jgi:hypothetical protein
MHHGDITGLFCKRCGGLLYRPKKNRVLAVVCNLRRRLERFVMRWRWLRDYEISLNRRAEVEQELFDMARGKRPLPDAEQCRKLAIRLGVPDKWRDAS